jgi:hypothetical protein
VAIWLARSPEAQQTADALAARTMRGVVRVEAESDAPQAAERAREGLRQAAAPPGRVADRAPGASGSRNWQPQAALG